MNSQQAQIQELIQSIDAALRKASPRLPWVMAGESEQQRQLLERTRQYLISLQQANLTPELPTPMPLSLPSDPALGPMAASAQSSGESAQQVLQAVLQEVTYLRTNIMQPMRGEVDELRQQRDALVSEIRELEAQRQQYALPPQVDTQQQQQALSEFLQSLMGRLQENLTVQVAEMLTTLESRALPASGPALESPPPGDAARFASYTPPLTPQERLDQLQRIQTQSDQLLLKLDTTLRVIFESLQRNIHTYEDSLSQGLDKMHTLGHQGEAIFTALVNRLAQQLGREASQYLQSSLEGTDWQALPGASGQRLSGISDASPLDSLMNELAESEATILQPPTGMGTSSRLTDLNREVNDLDLVSSAPDLDALDSGEMTMFQVDESLMATRFQDDDMTIFQINEAAIAPSAEIPLDDVPFDNAIDDIDSALELLNQISTELDTEEDTSDQAEVASPEGIYDELDALYQSLFGADVASDEGMEPPVDRHIADAEQAVSGDLTVDDLEGDEQNAAIGDFESQFFEGLADLSAEPAEAPFEATQASTSEVLPQETGQTVEELLFDEVPVADGGDQEDTQLLDMAAMAGQHAPADVISSLEELIALSDTASLDALRSDGSLTEEDVYIPASPDEDLLVSGTVVEAPRVELQVDADVLEQLDAELSTLEGRTPDLEPAEDLSFLSDLSTGEPEDISTSLEDAFREIPYEQPLTSEAQLAEIDDDDAFLEALTTPNPEPLPTVDETLLEELLLEDMDSSEMEEESLELLEDGSSDQTDAGEALQDQFSELPSGPWSAYVIADEELPGEPTPISTEVEASELELFLTQESLAEDFSSDDDDQTAAFFPEPEPASDLLESLIEEIPLTAFEEENLPPVDEALIDRLIEETPTEPVELNDEEMDLSALLAGEASTVAPADDSAGSLDEAWLDLSSSEPDESGEALFDLPESVPEESEPDWLNLSVDAAEEQDAMLELPDLSSGTASDGWLDLSTPESSTPDSDAALLGLTQASPENVGDERFSLPDMEEPGVVLADLPEPDLVLADLAEPTPEDLDAAWLDLSSTDSEEQSEALLQDLPEAPTAVSSDEWLGLSAPVAEEQDVALVAEFLGDTSLEADFDLNTQPVELAFEEELEAPVESPEPATSLDEDLFGFGIDLPELADSAPPPPPLVLEDGEPSPLAASEAIALTPAETPLPPDREDLTLEDFQDVMTTPPASIEDLLAEWPDDTALNEDVVRRDEASTAAEAPTFPLLAVDAPEVTPDMTLELTPESDIENTLDSFADALTTAASEDAATPMELATWFDGVEEIPPTIDVTPPGAQAVSLEDTSLFLQGLSSDAPPEPTLDDNAFTLDGLGELFESVPDTKPAPSVEPVSEPEEDLDLASLTSLGSDLGQAGIDLDQTDQEPDSEESKKKDLGDRPPEALGNLTATPPDAVEADLDAVNPLSTNPDLDYTSELILQAIGLQTDAVETATPLPDEGEPDLALMNLSADLEDQDEEVDPELAALFQRLRRSPSDLPDSDDPLGDRLELLRDQEDDLDSLIFSVTDPLEDDPTLFTPPSLTGAWKRLPPRSPWYLGIDLGTTGISAVLLHRPTATLHPMFWLEIKFPGPIHGSLPIPEKTYRLPVAVYLTPPTSGSNGASEVAIASLSITRQEFSHPMRQPLRDFKPSLQAGIPYYIADTAHWEPVLQWSDQRTIPLSSLHQALRALLTSLNYTSPEPPTGADTAVLSCGAMGLPDDTLQQALHDLAGVIVSYPSAWSDTYRFNVREAILAARLVDDPAQIYLVEESTATLLSALAPEQAVNLPTNLAPNLDLFQAHWQGGTLIINGGASVTELALVNLPEPLQRLSPPDMARRTLAYGGNALDQDIICQLIYPAWVREAHRPRQERDMAAPEADAAFRAGEDFDWAEPWAALGWEHLTLPVVGDPDVNSRQLLQQRLLGAGVGLGLLESARYLKLTLQHQDRGTIILGETSLTISRQDLGSRVLLPYIQRLNRELNHLLTQTGIPVLQVNQVLCTGGSASLAAIARWLRQKLPNATIVQDTYAQSTTPQHNHLSTCSRVAYGLAAVPLHPQMVDQGHHCYSDYFLLMELLRVFPDGPITLDGLLQVLEQRGVDTHVCRLAIVALLEGHLPAGLVPTDEDAAMLTPQSQHNRDYQALLAAPLFVREADQTYRPNPHQWQVFRRHLDTILATSYQKLSAPLDFILDTVATL